MNRISGAIFSTRRQTILDLDQLEFCLTGRCHWLVSFYRHRRSSVAVYRIGSQGCYFSRAAKNSKTFMTLICHNYMHGSWYLPDVVGMKVWDKIQGTIHFQWLEQVDFCIDSLICTYTILHTYIIDMKCYQINLQN